MTNKQLAPFKVEQYLFAYLLKFLITIGLLSFALFLIAINSKLTRSEQNFKPLDHHFVYL